MSQLTDCSKEIRMIFLLMALLFSSALFAEVKVMGDLARDADLGFSLNELNQELVVQRLVEQSAAAQAGLRDGDVVVSINNKSVTDPLSDRDLLMRVNGGSEVRLEVLRGAQHNTIEFTATPQQYRSVDGFSLTYGAVKTTDGAHLRTLIARPEQATGELPPLLLTQWVSCGSVIDRFGSSRDGVMGRIALELSMAVVLVERASDGDSEGPACHELDYNTELQHYTDAYRKLLATPGIDASRVFIYGSSLGSTTAPLLAQRLQGNGIKVAGVAIQGGGALTHFERMLNFDRIYLERRPDDVNPAVIHQQMLDRAVFQVEYLIKQRHPDDIAKDGDAMRAVRADIRGMGVNHHYGRPFAWHQQAAQHNFLGVWAELEVPILVMFAEFDQFEIEHGHKLVSEVVNQLRPGTATYVKLSGLGHSSWTFDNAIEAYSDRTGSYDPGPIRNALSQWLKSNL